MSVPEAVDVRLVRTGGFAGLRREYHLHSDSLDPDAAAELLRAAVAAVEHATTRPGGGPGPGGADRFGYSLVVSGAGMPSTHWERSEASMAPAERELVRLVERLARRD